jgi:hypothetical protein
MDVRAALQAAFCELARQNLMTFFPDPATARVSRRRYTKANAAAAVRP